MPGMKIDKYKINKKDDKRRKLTDTQKQNIRDMFFLGGLSIRHIAREYESVCSRRLIQFVLFPERDKKLKDQVKLEKRWLKYYDTEKNTLYKRKHREYKNKLLEKGLLVRN